MNTPVKLTFRKNAAGKIVCVPATVKKPPVSVTAVPPAAPPPPSALPVGTQSNLRMPPVGHDYFIPPTYTHLPAVLADHKARPEIYDTIECRKWRDQYGLKQVGIAFIWERLRYIYVIKKRMGEEFRLNNNYKGAYARLVMFNESDLAGFITIRELAE